jgi:hypothetical protein
MNEPRTYGELPDQRFRGMLVGACIYLGFGPFGTLLDLHFRVNFSSTFGLAAFAWQSGGEKI